MKFLDEFRNKKLTDIVAAKIRSIVNNKWRIMEVCGSQTHTIMKYNLEELLPKEVELIHGPGCPVCVTPPEIIDKAIKISREKGVILVSYGDMLRVPGTFENLLAAKQGDNVQIIYSPLDALRIAQENPERTIVFLAVGFETTAPGNAHAVITAAKKGIRNFLILPAHVLIPPAIRYILLSGKARVQGLLAPGHVCAVTGFNAYKQIAQNYKVPIAVTGFEPVDILEGILMLLNNLEEGKYGVENKYKRVVTEEGNKRAIDDMFKVFEVSDYNWRGIGIIENSGLIIKKEFRDFNAELYFDLTASPAVTPDCIAGEILQGIKKPVECPLFGKICTPVNPIGAPMVSAEGICAAYFQYKHSKIIL